MGANIFLIFVLSFNLYFFAGNIYSLEQQKKVVQIQFKIFIFYFHCIIIQNGTYSNI